VIKIHDPNHLYFIILVVATTFWWGTTKSRYKWTIQYSLRSMVILRFFGENSGPRRAYTNNNNDWYTTTIHQTKYLWWNINNCDEQIFYDYSEINQKGPPVRFITQSLFADLRFASIDYGKTNESLMRHIKIFF
jgi:hypothetical protein